MLGIDGNVVVGPPLSPLAPEAPEVMRPLTPVEAFNDAVAVPQPAARATSANNAPHTRPFRHLAISLKAKVRPTFSGKYAVRP